MTRRITLAILLTTWAVLIAGGATAYLAVRWALVAQLDQAIAARASTIPELARAERVRGAAEATAPAAGEAGPDAATAPARAPSTEPTRLRQRTAATTLPADGRADGWTSTAAGDLYLIKDDAGVTMSKPGGGQLQTDLRPLGATFARLPDGRRIRRLTLRGTARGAGAGGAGLPVTISYETSAEGIDRLLDRLTLAFAVFGLAAGLVTAAVARGVSRAALAPLRATADVIGTIDPRSLDRRIDDARLPPELLPVARRLNEMLARIQTAYEHRQQFLADASHELRTPVAAMVTALEVSLRRPRDGAAYRQALETCLGDARLLRRLVERLMEQCRADTLSHDEEPVEVDLAPLLAQCAEQAATLGAGRGVTLEREFPSPLPAVTQPGRLRSVVANLLSNAIEYNRDNGTVRLSVERSGAWLQLAVTDTGPGIAPEHLPHLFEPFYRADKARSQQEGHLGLGLSLVESHVHALGGRIAVRSTAGVGTTFEVHLPAGAPSAAPAAPAAPAAESQPEPTWMDGGR